jgi:hypothetical protein
VKRVCVAVVLGAFVSAAYAAPAGATATFDGQCSIDGKTQFGLPLRFYPQEMDWSFTSNVGGGRCTGTLNGVPVVNTPLNVTVDAHGPISCGVAGYSLNAQFEGIFPAAVGDRKLKGSLSLGAVAAQNAVYVEGNEGGFAAGRASFAGQNDQVAVLQGCAEGNTVTSLNVNVLIQTVRPVRG